MNKQSQWVLLLATSMVSFMSTIDASIVNIAVPQLSKDLHVPMNQAEWVVSVYLVLICVLLIFFGKLSDQVGRIPIFQIGTLIFVAGSLGCGLSTTLPIMLAARTVQALGASMTMATNFGIITQIFPANRHGVALGVNSSFVQVGNIMGPGLGGLILSVLSWHYIFFVNVPIGLIAFAFGYKIFPHEQRKHHTLSIDWLGYGAYAVAIVSFFIAIYWGQTVGFTQPAIIGLWILTLIFITLFIMRENHTDNPLIQLHIFKNWGFSIGIISTMLVFAIGYFNNMIMPYYLQETLKYSSAIAGLILMSIPIINIFSAPVGGILGDRIGAERVSLYALLLFILPELIFIFITPTWGVVWLVVGLMLFGLANGTFQNNPMIMGNADKKYQGIAGSIAALARNLGMAIGLALATSLLYSGISRQAGRRITTYPTKHPQWFIAGMHYSYWWALGLVIIALALVAALVRKQHSTQNN